MRHSDQSENCFAALAKKVKVMEMSALPQPRTYPLCCWQSL